MNTPYLMLARYQQLENMQAYSRQENEEILGALENIQETVPELVRQLYAAVEILNGANVPHRLNIEAADDALRAVLPLRDVIEVLQERFESEV